MMARVKNPLFSESASGTLGGLTYKPNGYGNTVGRRSITPSLQTPAQTTQRGRLAIAQHAWPTLSDADRAAWDSMAVLPMTGRNLFVGSYCRWQMMGLAGLPSPIRYQYYDKIYDTDFAQSQLDPPKISITWTYDGDSNSYVNIYTLATYSNRETPKPRKLIYSGMDVSYFGTIEVPVKCAAPVIHVRIEVVSIDSGMISQKILLRKNITWV